MDGEARRPGRSGFDLEDVSDEDARTIGQGPIDWLARSSDAYAGTGQRCRRPGEGDCHGQYNES